MKFRKKSIVVEAKQWFKNGDHREVQSFGRGLTIALNPCTECTSTLDKHGWIQTLDGGHKVCPGDWIITGVKGEHYPCKPEIFKLTYESVAA